MKISNSLEPYNRLYGFVGVIHLKITYNSKQFSSYAVH